jgi:hypothetical protein
MNRRDLPTVDGSPLQRLAAAAAKHERKLLESEAEEERRRTRTAQREALVEDARLTLKEITSELKRRVSESILNAQVRENNEGLTIRVAGAQLELELKVSKYGAGDFPRSNWDVAAGSAIGVEQDAPPHSRSASLWFTRRNYPKEEFRWYEVGYESNPLSGRGFKTEPTAVNAELADRAHWNAMDVVQTSYNPVPIDGENMAEFCDRWLQILAEACDGNLDRLPKSLLRGS